MADFATSISPVSAGPSGLPSPETYCTRVPGRTIRKIADEYRFHIS